MIHKIKQFSVKNKYAYSIIYFSYLILEKILAVIFLCLRIFPIKENKIVFCTAKGKRYGDNPMYISDELINREKEYDMVWLLKENVEEEIPQSVRRVKYNLFTEMIELATAKVWVDSNFKYSWIKKRKKQLYVQTWHGSYGIKKICYDSKKNFSKIDQRNNDINVDSFDLMISNSKKTTEIYRSAFRYGGEILECGSPRNDIIISAPKKNKEKVIKYFAIEDKKIVLYAPTYRANYGVDKFELNYKILIQTLEKKYGGEWVVLVRLHPYNLKEAEKLAIYNEKILNASQYSIMQDLLVASDILITDYSSCMFDFATTRKPCFLYATDVEEYRNDRDYYFDIKDLPFPLAENNEQLEENILNFDEEVYQKKLNELFEQVGLCETGHASEKVADYIEQWMKEH